MTWKFVKLWRYWLVLLLGLALFVLAAAQATDPHRASNGRELFIGVATKAITGVLAIMVIRVVQDVMDRLQALHSRMDLLEDRLEAAELSLPSPHLETPAGPPPHAESANQRSGITEPT